MELDMKQLDPVSIQSPTAAGFGTGTVDGRQALDLAHMPLICTDPVGVCDQSI